jgi:hypothetical protein
VLYFYRSSPCDPAHLPWHRPSTLDDSSGGFDVTRPPLARPTINFRHLANETKLALQKTRKRWTTIYSEQRLTDDDYDDWSVHRRNGLIRCRRPVEMCESSMFYTSSHRTTKQETSPAIYRRVGLLRRRHGMLTLTWVYFRVGANLHRN